MIGLVASVVSNLAVHLRPSRPLDDTLDVFPCHGVGGMVGMVATGVFAKDVGLIYGQDAHLPHHLLALVIVSAFSFVGSLILYKVTDLIIPLRVTEDRRKKASTSASTPNRFSRPPKSVLISPHERSERKLRPFFCESILLRIYLAFYSGWPKILVFMSHFSVSYKDQLVIVKCPKEMNASSAQELTDLIKNWLVSPVKCYIFDFEGVTNLSPVIFKASRFFSAH